MALVLEVILVSKKGYVDAEVVRSFIGRYKTKSGNIARITARKGDIIEIERGSTDWFKAGLVKTADKKGK